MIPFKYTENLTNGKNKNTILVDKNKLLRYIKKSNGDSPKVCKASLTTVMEQRPFLKDNIINY